MTYRIHIIAVPELTPHPRHDITIKSIKLYILYIYIYICDIYIYIL